MIGTTAVIIPAYNAERFLSAALDSVLAQTRPVDRIVVVDDASTDDTVALAQGYASRGQSIDVLTGAPNGGPGSARNRGLRHTSASTVFFLDADDSWLPGHCELLIDALERHEHAGFVHSFPTGRLAASSRETGTNVVTEEVYEGVWSLLYQSDVPQSAVAARRATVLAVGAYGDGQRYAEDYDLWLRMASVAPYVAIMVETYDRGAHAGQATLNSIEMHRGAWEARHRLFAHAADRGAPLDPHQWSTVLLRAFEHDLAGAWQTRSGALLDAVLESHAMVPDSGTIYRRWRRRRRYVWPFWRAAAGVWDALPEHARQLLRQATAG